MEIQEWMIILARTLHLGSESSAASLLAPSMKQSFNVCLERVGGVVSTMHSRIDSKIQDRNEQWFVRATTNTFELLFEIRCILDVTRTVETEQSLSRANLEFECRRRPLGYTNQHVKHTKGRYHVAPGYGK